MEGNRKRKRKAPLRAPTEVDVERIEAFTTSARKHLLKQLAGKKNIAISLALETEIRKRVAPSAIGNYLNLKAIVDDVTFEINNLGRRIRRYQFIERYRDVFLSPDREMMMAFLEHTHSMRTAELYTILERGADLIRLCGVLVVNLGLPATNAAAKYQKRFRKEFERRLRERHRIVHAHERPSLLSRLLSTPAEAFDDPTFVDAFTEIFADVVAILGHVRGKEANELMKEQASGAFRREYLLAVDLEAAAMWRILSECVAEALTLDVAPQKASQKTPARKM